MSNVDRGYDWRKVRSKVIKRDNGKCVACDMSRAEHKERYDQDLEVHHKTPSHVFEDDDGTTFERFAHHEKNLVTLCEGCHRLAESKGSVYALGVRPKPAVRKRYQRLKPFELSHTEFMDDLLDAYETVKNGEVNEIRSEVEVEINPDSIAEPLADELVNRYTGVDEAELAGKIATDVEKRLRDWQYNQTR